MMARTCKCGGTDFFIVKESERPRQVGLYCSDCGRWQKWLSKDEERLFIHEQQAQMTKAVDDLLSENALQKIDLSYEEVRDKLKSMERNPDELFERVKSRVEEKAIVMSTKALPHKYMRAIGTRELFQILKEEL